MNKKLTAKIQKLVPMLGENEVVFSTSIAIEPAERDLILKKGSIYTVFDLKSPNPINVSLITKVINDVLFDSYYHSDNISPIQSLEKSIVNINEKLTHFANESRSEDATHQLEDGTPVAQKVVFNIIAGVLWGNVLYIVQYGQGKSFLMRQGEVKEVSATTEGNFSVASGVVKDDDVIILCTDKFAGSYPPEKLLGTALSSNDLDPEQSCTILKFLVDTEFTGDEIVDFNIEKANKGSKLGDMFTNIKDKLPKKEQKEEQIATLAGAVGDEGASAPPPPPPTTPPPPAPEQKQEPAGLPPLPQEQPGVVTKPDVGALSGSSDNVMTSATSSSNSRVVPADSVSAPQPEHPDQLPKVPTGQMPSPTNGGPDIKIKSKAAPKFGRGPKPIVVFIIVVLGLALSATLILSANRPQTDDSAQEADGDSSSLQVLDGPEPEPQPESQIEKQPETTSTEEQDKANKVQRIDAQPFYDIKLADETAAPSDIVVFNNTVVATDAASGKIFTSGLTTPKFTALEQTFPGISNAMNFDGALRFADDAGYKEYNLIDDTVDQSFAGTFGVSSTYLGNIYSIDGTAITKNTVSGEELDPATWGENAELSEAVAMDIAFSIYVLLPDELAVYTQGAKANFPTTGLDAPLNGATDVETDVNFDNIYIADAGNNRIVVLDTDGNFVKQLKAEKETEWDDIKSIAVNSSETLMFVLNGSRVFEVDLTVEPDFGEQEEVATDGTADTGDVQGASDEADEDVETDGTDDTIETDGTDDSVDTDGTSDTT